MRRSYLLAGVVVTGLTLVLAFRVLPGTATAAGAPDPQVVGDRHVQLVAERQLGPGGDAAGTADPVGGEAAFAQDARPAEITVGTGAAAVAVGFLVHLALRCAWGPLRAAVEWWRESRFVP